MSGGLGTWCDPNTAKSDLYPLGVDLKLTLAMLVKDNLCQGLNTGDSPSFGFRTEKTSWMTAETSSYNLKKVKLLSFQSP